MRELVFDLVRSGKVLLPGGVNGCYGGQLAYLAVEEGNIERMSPSSLER